MDPLPKSICHKCLFKLETTYEFRELCLQSNEFLKSRLLLDTNDPQVLEYCNSLKRTHETLQLRNDLKVSFLYCIMSSVPYFVPQISCIIVMSSTRLILTLF